MDTLEATKMVMSRIQKLDPENATKIMGYILIQDQGDNEMIRLAFGPESLLISVIKEAKAFLDISSNTSSTPRNTPQIIIPNNGFHHLNNPSSPSSPWSHHHHRDSPRPASYAAVVNNNGAAGGGGSSVSSFYTDEFSDSNQLQFFDEANNSTMELNNDPMADVHHHHHHLHRRSCSVNDIFLAGGGADDGNGGFGGWRPCMYFARGFCKNGNSCKFVHGGGFGDELGMAGSSSPTGPIGLAGSPSGKMDGFEDLIRFKAIQQQQRIAAMTAAAGGVPHYPFNRCMNNYLNENPSMFGPVQDVRIPYQQKRMFGFVTFMLPETVKAILAKGNPHFVCDSRVLVKPYKEKGKMPDKKHQQHMERGDFSGCLSPTALESAEPFDHIPFGARMFNHDMMLRRKLEERELQQAIEFQDRRLMNLHLTDLKNHQLQRSFSLGVSIPSPTHMNQTRMFSPNDNNDEFVSGAIISNQDSINSVCDESDSNVQQLEVKEESSDPNESVKIESSFEHVLPDNLFASPTKSATADQQTIFSTDMPETDFGVAISTNVTSKCQAIEM
ncbi:zinc finger CCCH domain-containing protein 53-like isoform X3 [Rutidosis leptorrhynchoides]|uniref:zinc finger CCCH domain-containing protein 53-like isoform X3 n=1 Tax=Rutidosis leptorrhynchoides TaxID=125765 RepID=UPI003A9938CF